MIKGSCLCRNVRYEIFGQVGEIVHCHCQTCRKAHGAAFSSVAAVEDSDFKLFGEQFLKTFESSEGKKRFFCGFCGTHIYAKRDRTSHVILRLGSLDDDPNSAEKSHIWVSQKAHWYTIGNDLVEYSEFE